MVKCTVTPEELVALHRCLSSKLCMRIFKVLAAERKPLNISSICRKAGCSSGNAVKHLRNMVELGIVEEDYCAGFHMFALKEGDFTELMKQSIRVLEAEGKTQKVVKS